MPLLLRHILAILTIFVISTSVVEAQRVVVIDAGHGGKSPGATFGKFYEKNINLAIALGVEEHLKTLAPKIKVIQTRRNDVDIDLYKRADIANDNKAKLFISIHANANPSSSANGTETYVMGVDKSGKNLSVAMAENSVIALEDDYHNKYEGYDPKSAESFIIFSLMQYAYSEKSLDFASLVEKQYAQRTSMRSRGVKQAGFLVLWRTTMPSVLTEVGFISNENDRNYITTKEGQNSLALSLAKAIVEFFDNPNEDNSKGVATPTMTQPAKPFTTTDEPKEDYKEPPEGVVEGCDKIFYTVQIRTSTNKLPINPTNFGQWVALIKEFYAQKMYKYSVGEVFSYKEALTLQAKLKQKYNDCFVVAYKGNKRITLKEAQQILNK